jgi:uncharacterized protein YoxC
MKRKNLEIIVLVAGALIIALGVLVLMGGASGSRMANIIFPLGFLVYIIYSIMNTNSLQKEIRGLNSHIDGLKQEIANYKEKLAQKEKEVTQLAEEVNQLKASLEEKEAELEKQAAALKSLKENPPTK